VTSSTRIVVSMEDVRAALADWHAQFRGHPEPLRAQLFTEIERNDSGTYASQQAPGFFALLQKHGTTV
jgi:hypothetical protein